MQPRGGAMNCTLSDSPESCLRSFHARNDFTQNHCPLPLFFGMGAVFGGCPVGSSWGNSAGSEIRNGEGEGGRIQSNETPSFACLQCTIDVHRACIYDCINSVNGVE